MQSAIQLHTSGPKAVLSSKFVIPISPGKDTHMQQKQSGTKRNYMGQRLCLHTERPASAATEGGRAGCFLPGPKPRVFYSLSSLKPTLTRCKLHWLINLTFLYVNKKKLNLWCNVGLPKSSRGGKNILLKILDIQWKFISLMLLQSEQ